MPPLKSLQNGSITEYRIKYSGKDDSRLELQTNQTYYLLTGLQKFTRYNISVEAGNQVGFGPSKYINVTTLVDGMKLNDFFYQIVGDFKYLDEPIKCQCCRHIETSQLICIANQLTGFYMRATSALNGLSNIGYV